MRNFILKLMVLIPVLGFAQYGANTEYKKFTKSEKKFNDWSIDFYAGVPLMQSSDLTSFNNQSTLDGNGKKNKLTLGYDFQLGITKYITHSVAVQVLYANGLSHQQVASKDVTGSTKYQSLSLIGDINLSSLFRRVDNKSTYRWALHAYAGVGVLDYDTKLNQKGYDYNASVAAQNTLGGGSVLIPSPGTPNGSSDNMKERGYYKGYAWTKNPVGSFFGQVGVGLKFKVNRRFDVLGKAMYVISGDDNFDAGGTGNGQQSYSNLNNIKKDDSDDMVTFHVGLSYKLGKHQEHLQWFDALHDLYPQKSGPASSGVCMNDKDDDAVCDDLDKQLDTPKGCRVDGSGVAMDTDYDGLIDCLDDCPTVPGPVDNKGCPKAGTPPIYTAPEGGTKAVLPAIEFLLDSDKLTKESSPILDNAANIIKEFFPNDQIIVEGHTDDWNTEAYNQNLSQRRVETVVKYLGTKGVNTANLIPVGKGESELKLPQCRPASKCTDAENKKNRRVVFKLK